MAKWDCEICCGRGTVRLALHKRSANISVSASEAISVDEMSREYPCPECGIKANVERVFAVDVHARVDTRAPSEAMPHIKEGVAHRLVDALLRSGFIEFTEGKVGSTGLGLSTPIIGTLYAVHPGEARQTIESRIRERQDQFAKVVAEEAIRQIHNWGSASRYVDGRIGKREAENFIREAVKRIGASWSKEHELHARGDLAEHV